MPAARAVGSPPASTPWQAAAGLVTLRQTGALQQRIVESGRVLAGGSAGILLLYDHQTGQFLPTVPSVAMGLDERWLPLSDEQATALLQIAREALSNVTRHAQAAGAEVQLAYGDKGVVLHIRDVGRGFDPAAWRSEEHHGLRNLRTRIEEAGGRLSVASDPQRDPQRGPRAGTTVTAFLPRF